MKKFKCKGWHSSFIGMIILIFLFLFENCGDGGNGEGENQNCAIPSMMEDWENAGFNFIVRETDDPLILVSDGGSIFVGSIYYDDQFASYPMALVGENIDETNSNLTEGAIDWNWSGNIETGEEIDDVVGKLKITGGSIDIFDLAIEGRQLSNMVGSCSVPGNIAPQMSSVLTEVTTLYDRPIDDPLEPFTCSGSGWDTSSDTAVYEFKDPIRIGDDRNYNSNHSIDFKISSPSGRSYSKSFTVSSDCHFTEAKIQYTIAGAKEAAKFYLNDSLVGRTRNPGNNATSVASGSVDITSKLRNGSNTLKVSTVLYPGDEINPYDDIEIYNLRITLFR